MQKILDLYQVSKVYPNATKALDSISFSLNQGEFVGLLGRNGAGKSTLIHCIANVLQPSHGKIETFLQTTKDIGWVSQTSSIDWFLSVKDNVRLGARLGGSSFFNADARIKNALQVVDLYDKQHENPEMLSGGQQKRVQVARALAQDPVFYLLDEPTTGLDVQTTESFFEHMKNLCSSEKTCLVSTHELDALQQVATRVLMISQGKLVSDESMDTFIKKFSPNLYSLKEAFKYAEKHF